MNLHIFRRNKAKYIVIYKTQKNLIKCARISTYAEVEKFKETLRIKNYELVSVEVD